MVLTERALRSLICSIAAHQNVAITIRNENVGQNIQFLVIMNHAKHAHQYLDEIKRALVEIGENYVQKIVCSYVDVPTRKILHGRTNNITTIGRQWLLRVAVQNKDVVA